MPLRLTWAVSLHMGSQEASGPGPRPYESSLQLPSGYQEYAIFHNVLMRSETELLFFVPDDSAAETAARHIPDVAEFLNRQWWQRPNMHLPPLKVGLARKVVGLHRLRMRGLFRAVHAASNNPCPVGLSAEYIFSLLYCLVDLFQMRLALPCCAWPPSQQIGPAAAQVHCVCQRLLVCTSAWCGSFCSKNWHSACMPLGVMQVTIVTPSLHAQYPDRCYRWIEHNTIWYSGTPFDHQNLYHFLYDNLIPLITAASDLGWYDVDKFMKR